MSAERRFTLEGSGIDPEWLAAEIQKRVQERRSSGLFNNQVESMLEMPLVPDKGMERLSPIEKLHFSTDRALSSWEVTPAYPVATQKRLFAPVIIFLKRILRFWSRVAVGPIIRRQSIFNMYVSNALDAIRKEALTRRAQEKADDEDLCFLAESMTDPDEAEKFVEECVGWLKESKVAFILGPCPRSLVGKLESEGTSVIKISSCDSWNIEGAKYSQLREAPTIFLERISENSLEALVVPELAFWLRPERLMRIIRMSYLALRHGGRIVVFVRSFATGSLSPWCSPDVMIRALEMAGFSNLQVKPLNREKANTGFVVCGQKSPED